MNDKRAMSNTLLSTTKRNIVIVFFAQLFTAIFGIAKALVLPVAIQSLEQYAYWQIYLFYYSYVLIATLGYHEGIYLKYSIYDKGNMPYAKLRNANRLQAAMLVVFTAVCFVGASLMPEAGRRFAYIAVSLTILSAGITELNFRFLQSTNNMRLYSLCSILDKVLFVPILIYCLIVKSVDCELLIVSDLVIRYIVLVVMCVICRDYWIGRGESLYSSIREWKDNILSGGKIIVANYMSILLTGLGRIVIEYGGNLANYSFYSFSVTISNFLSIFVSSVGLTIFPALKRTDVTKYREIYDDLLKILIVIGIIGFGVYYPATLFVNYVIPNYNESLQYLGIVMCVVFFNAVDSVCNVNILKAMRQEKTIMLNNIISICVFAILLPIYFIFERSTIIIAIITLVAVAAKCMLSKKYAEKCLSITCNIETANLIFSVVIYICITSWLPLLPSFVAYLMLLTAELLIYRKAISVLLKKYFLKGRH